MKIIDHNHNLVIKVNNHKLINKIIVLYQVIIILIIIYHHL